MEAITPLNLKDIENHLRKRLQEALGDGISCEVNCWVQDETLLVFIQCGREILGVNQQFLAKLSDDLPKTFEHYDYTLRIYWVLEGGVYPLTGETSVTQKILPLLTSTSPLTSINISQGLNLYKVANKFKKRPYQRIFGKIIGIGLGFSLGVGCLYILTRPCSFGNCPQLNQAKTEAEAALKPITGLSSEFELEQAQKQLSDAIQLLEPIPVWSSHYTSARALLSQYDEHKMYLEALRVATQQAQEGETYITGESQSLEEWKERKQELEEAIKMLPPPDPSKRFENPINSKKRQYERYLQGIEQRIQAETVATQRLNRGLEAGKLALTRQNTARSLEDWQLVESAWQNALKQLQEIPVDTTVYQASRQYWQQYNNELIKAQAKRQKEEQSYYLWQQAQEQAKKAIFLQNQSQWAEAVEKWQDSITLLQQVPKSSFYYQQVQPFLSSYQLSLNKAEIEAKKALNRQEVNNYLQNLCERPEKICNYIVEENLVKVTLTKEYNQKILAAALQAKQQGNKGIQLNLINHISRLEKGLRNLSLHGRKPVELYHSDGRLMMTFQP